MTTEWLFMITGEAQTHRRGIAYLLAALGGSLVLACILIFWDVVDGGCYVFSALVCPVWFIVSGIKTAIQRPPFLIATARLLIPVGVLLLAICNYTVQRQIAKANSATLIQACESYYKDNGKYPDRLDQLVPRYLGSVPMAKYCLSGGFWYFPQQHMFFYEDIPPFGRPVYTFDDKRWGYVD